MSCNFGGHTYKAPPNFQPAHVNGCVFADEVVDTIDIRLRHDLRPRRIWQTVVVSETYNITNYCLI
jgi:hypothetical protein